MLQNLEIINDDENVEIATNHNVFDEKVGFENKGLINNIDTKNYQFGEKLSNIDILTNEISIPQMPLQSKVPYNGECVIFDTKSLKHLQIENVNESLDEKCEKKMQNLNDDAIFNLQNITGTDDVAFLPYIPIFEPFQQYVDDINDIPNPLFKIQKSKILSVEKFVKRMKKHTRYFKCRKCKNCMNNLQCESPLETQAFNEWSSNKYKTWKKIEKNEINDVTINKNVDIKNESIYNDENFDTNEGVTKNEKIQKRINGVDLLSIPLKTKSIIVNGTDNNYVDNNDTTCNFNHNIIYQKNINFNKMVPMLNTHTSNAINSMASIFINYYSSKIY